MSKGRTGRIAATVAAIAAIAMIAFAGIAGATHPATGGGGGAKKLPKVNMERVLLAGQLDQFRRGNAHTAGAKKSVKRVQRALRSKGYKVAVDGNFGSQTSDRYSKWQKRSTGASGYGANGLVGKTSLKKLGHKRFRVTHIVRPGKHTSYGGSPVNLRTKRMLIGAAHRLGKHCKLDLTKGSYQGSDSSSAATHAAGGAVDLNINVRCGHTIHRVVKSLRKVGFAAWHRTPAQGFSPHIHAIAISDPDMSTPESNAGEFTAMHQVADYAKHENGLHYPTSAKLDRKLHTWEQYKRARR